ncbi:hypothetical protein ACV3V0_07905 [Clostridium perfringens]
MIEIYYKGNLVIGVDSILWLIGDNYKLREDIITGIDDFFSSKVLDNTNVNILENERTISKKDFLYIKVDSDVLLEKEYSGEKTTFCRKALEKLMDLNVESNDILDGLNKNLSDLIDSNKYIKSVCDTFKNDSINTFNVSSSEISRKILLDYILDIGYRQLDKSKSARFAKISAIIKIIEVYIRVFEIKKRVLIVFDEIDNKISLTERKLLCNTIKTMIDNERCSVIFCTKDIMFLESVYNVDDLNKISYISRNVLCFANKDMIIKDILDNYPGFLEYSYAEEIIVKIMISYYDRLLSGNLDETIAPDIKKMISTILSL